MFACPSRRALFSCAAHASPTSRRLISTATANSLGPQLQRPMRRYSSSSSSNSKPFGPNNRGLASKPGAFRKRDRQCDNERPTTAATTTQTVTPPIPGREVPEVEVSSGDSSAIAEEAQKSEEQKNSPLPFVARTDHLRAKDIHASAFFALHRPVSVSFPVPGIYSSAAFQKLFEESSPLSTLELQRIQLDVQARQRSGGNAEAADADGVLNADDVRAFARAASSGQAEQKAAAASSYTDPQVKMMNPVLFNQYLPFQPPPPPQPIPEAVLKAPFQQLKSIRVINDRTADGGERQRGYIVTFIPLDGSGRLAGGGRKRVMMHSRQPTMQALSVKRQRKLKMKKHKYKKLMKRTRTLRRKLEKQ